MKRSQYFSVEIICMTPSYSSCKNGMYTFLGPSRPFRYLKQIKLLPDPTM